MILPVCWCLRIELPKGGRALASRVVRGHPEDREGELPAGAVTSLQEQARKGGKRGRDRPAVPVSGRESRESTAAAESDLLSPLRRGGCRCRGVWTLWHMRRVAFFNCLWPRARTRTCIYPVASTYLVRPYFTASVSTSRCFGLMDIEFPH